MSEVTQKSNLNQVSDWLQVWNDQSALRERAETRAIDEVTPILKQYLTQSGQILEGGCGPGEWVCYLRARGYSVIGLDFCTSVLQESIKQEPTLPFVAGDVTKLPIKDASLDAILSFGVVEHFEGGPYAALWECNRVLKPGGLLFVSVPHMNLLRRTPFLERIRKSALLRKMLKLRQEFWQYKFTTQQVQGFLQATAFSTISLFPLYHEGGLAFDLFFLKNKIRPWEATNSGKALTRALKAISPWITNHMILAVAVKRGE